MAITTRLLTTTDLERQLLGPGGSADMTQSGPIEEMGICPIVELLELCELIKKGKVNSNLASFRLGIQALREGPVRRGEVIIVTLDQQRLADALFERDEHIVTGLWPLAANRQISPARSVRRLLLRPSDQTWWNGDIYAEAEAIYGFVEELDTDTNA
jgi:hypothetical protein